MKTLHIRTHEVHEKKIYRHKHPHVKEWGELITFTFLVAKQTNKKQEKENRTNQNKAK